jgi:hypothetical protein
MEDKEKVLEQLDNIHNYIVDSEDNAPFNANIILLWAFTSAIMFLGFEDILVFGISYAILFVIGVSVLAYEIKLFISYLWVN